MKHSVALMAMTLSASLIGSTEAHLPEMTVSADGSKKSVGDRAHRAFNKTKLYKPNGARECARRARQSAALQSKSAA